MTRENAISADRLGAMGITAQSWGEDIRSGASPGHVCVSGGRIVGYCFGARRTGEIVVLALLPDFECQGIGRKLLSLVVAELIHEGRHRLFLGCSADPTSRSHGFYRHLGWQSTREFDRYGDEILEYFAPTEQTVSAQVIFHTQRLIGRLLQPGDLGAMLEVYGDPDAMRWVGDGVPLTQEQCIEWLTVTEHNYRTRGYGMSTLVEASSGETVGFCGLVHPDDQSEAEIKYALKRRYWGVGLATEAAQAMLDYGARAKGLRRIIATAAPENLASHRVLLKAGMARAELRRNHDGSSTQLFCWVATP